MFQEFPDDNINDNFLSERRQKIAEQSILNMEDKKNDLKRSKSIFIGAVSGMALAGIVGWFALSPRYAAENVGEIPVIRRPQTAVKVLPSDPGGMEILNQDKTVYNIIDNQDNNTIESILPPPEQPQLPIIKAEEAQPTPSPMEETVVGTSQVNAAQETNVAQANSVSAVVNEVAEEKLPTIKEASEKQNQEIKKVEETKKEPAPAKKEAKKEEANIKKTSAASGNWQIQLMSSPNKKAVESAWNNMVKKHPALQGQPYEIETADLGAKGTYYRLKAGAFADRSGADDLCNKVKKQGGSCIVKKK